MKKKEKYWYISISIYLKRYLYGAKKILIWRFSSKEIWNCLIKGSHWFPAVTWNKKSHFDPTRSVFVIFTPINQKLFWFQKPILFLFEEKMLVWIENLQLFLVIFSWLQMDIFLSLLFFPPENYIRHLMQIASLWHCQHEMSNPICWEK